MVEEEKEEEEEEKEELLCVQHYSFAPFLT
jgi:hypothetical protein